MTDGTYAFLGIKCAQCQEPLMRITESKTNDFVVCPNCGASGNYEEVIKNSGGLTKTPLDKKLVDFIEKKWVARKLRGQ